MARTDRTERIAASIADAAGLPGAAETLATLPASALGSLLLAVHRSRAGAVRASQLLAAAGERLFRPSTVDGRMFHRFDAVAFEAARAFDALDVAPVAPFGACAALAGIDQNNVLTALRRAEVLADPTVALALAAATRRRPPVARADVVRLCTSARLVRMQSLEDAPAEFTPHFRLFALVTAGRDAGEHRFETDALAEHVLAWLRLADGLRRAGFSVKGARVEVSDMAAVEALCRAQGVSVKAIRAVAAAHRLGAGAEVLGASARRCRGRESLAQVPGAAESMRAAGPRQAVAGRDCEPSRCKPSALRGAAGPEPRVAEPGKEPVQEVVDATEVQGPRDPTKSQGNATGLKVPGRPIMEIMST